MKIYNNLNIDKRHQNSVVAIGNFDGIHLGHQKVINQAKQKSLKIDYLWGYNVLLIPTMFFNKK